MSSDRFCILLVKCFGKKKENIFFMNWSTSKVEILPGTLLLLLNSIRNSINFSDQDTKFVLKTLDQEGIQVTCSANEFQHITSEQYNLLISVPSCSDRFGIFANKEWLQEGVRLVMGDIVQVYKKSKVRDLIGIIRFKGTAKGVIGTYFGVELYEKGLGDSDGTFRSESFFRCAPKSAIFVALHRIRHYKGPVPLRLPSISGTAANSVIQFNTYNGLKIGERVVWFSDSGPEAAEVKWIGILPDCKSDDIAVGVEFDNPVGTGTGKYKDGRLFTARQNHASLIPILGLMKESELKGDFQPVTCEESSEVGDRMTGKFVIDTMFPEESFEVGGRRIGKGVEGTSGSLSAFPQNEEVTGETHDVGGNLSEVSLNEEEETNEAQNVVKR